MDEEASSLINQNFDINHPKLYMKISDNLDLVMIGTKGETFF